MIYDFPEVGLYTQLQTLILWIDGRNYYTIFKSSVIREPRGLAKFFGFIIFFALVFGKVKPLAIFEHSQKTNFLW